MRVAWTRGLRRLHTRSSEDFQQFWCGHLQLRGLLGRRDVIKLGPGGRWYGRL